MYNDENHIYHYNYQNQPNDGEPVRRYYANVENDSFRNFDPPVRDMKPAKKKRRGARVVALALACALIGGAAGGGAVWYANRNGAPVVRETTIHMADRSVENGSGNASDNASGMTAIPAGKTVLTEEQVYETRVNSVVSINVKGASANNIFGQPVETASSGSGFILTRDGYIVTNYHVVSGAQNVKVTLYDGADYDAAIIGGDKDYDIAVIKIEGDDFQPVTLGDSNQLKVGAHITTIGNPLGELTFSMSEGIASSVNRAINVDGTPFNMIQITCAVNPGNSGGPLFNQYGEVIGIVSAKYSNYSSTAVEGLGFAIPINDVLSMIEDIITNGYVANKPNLGITAGSMTAQMAAQYQYSQTTGVFVYSVNEGSAAANAGLKMGDVIIKVDDLEIKTLEDLNAAKKKYSAGDTCEITVFRPDGNITTQLTWDSVPAEQMQATPTEAPAQNINPYGDNTIPYYGDLFDYFFGNRYGFGR